MNCRVWLLGSGVILNLVVWSSIGWAASPMFLSHPPMRPLPVASARPLSTGPAHFVDPRQGDDANPGRENSPWKSLRHAVGQLEAGETLYLRGGIYYEQFTIENNGSAEKPITIRGYPGELAVIDGGLREFFESPQDAWEPVSDGAKDEYRSVKTYPDLGGGEGNTNLLGNFGDSMIPLHGYRYLTDLRSGNEFFSELDAGKTEAGEGVYCGPGLFHDSTTQRIHVRLSHTNQKALGENNYRGVTDPRKISLVVAGIDSGSALTLDGASYVRVQDLVVRGARIATVDIRNSRNIEFESVTVYGGSTAFAVGGSAGLRLWNSACRGIAAPWTYRGSLKYRAIEARIFSASGWIPTGRENHDFELAYSEFTDSVDGVFLGNVRNVRFHHNLVENVSDDGMFLTATTAYDGTTPCGNIAIYQNRFARCLTTFAFGVGHGRQKMTPNGRQTGAGVRIYRNVFDFRQPVMYAQPLENETQWTSYGRMTGDHGSPLWEPMTIYHNTILLAEPPFRAYYLAGLGASLGGGSTRQLFNNIVVQSSGAPGNVLPAVVPRMTEKEIEQAKAKRSPRSSPLADLLDGELEEKPKKRELAAELNSAELGSLKKKLDTEKEFKPPLPVNFQADGNLHWSHDPQFAEKEMFSRFRNSPDFETSKRLYEKGWTASDRVDDPKLVSYSTDWKQEVDGSLLKESPARDAGVPLPKDWENPLGKQDQGAPDVGAIPFGVEPWRVGMQGRLTVFGKPVTAETIAASPEKFLLEDMAGKKNAVESTSKPAAIVQGYPAFDAPLVAFALRRRNASFESLERTWLSPTEYGKFRLVVIVGDLPRAKIEPNSYSEEDLKQVERYLREGGTLLLMRGNARLFGSPEGRQFLTSLTGSSAGKTGGEPNEILLPDHPWVKHLAANKQAWINERSPQTIFASQGDAIIGNGSGKASLYRVKVGQGQLIYLGWDISASLPNGRSSSTTEQELAYEAQMQILMNIIESIYPGP